MLHGTHQPERPAIGRPIAIGGRPHLH
jgi:hypothetical protein